MTNDCNELNNEKFELRINFNNIFIELIITFKKPKLDFQSALMGIKLIKFINELERRNI